MIDWNIIVSQIATVAFDIVYFGAIISTIVVIILDNRNPVKTMAWILILLSSQLSVLFFISSLVGVSVGNVSSVKKVMTAF